jgi:hypothetical protein
MKITLHTFGEMNISTPSLSTCFDIISQWSDSQSRSVTGRLCAIAICICSDDTRLPKQRHVTNTVDYGSRCLDVLLGADVPVSQILESGMQCIGLMAGALPSAAEVEETENFTEPPEQET